MCQPSDGSTCEDYVANNPSYFEEAYCLINSISVFDITAEPVVTSSVEERIQDGETPPANNVCPTGYSAGHKFAAVPAKTEHEVAPLDACSMWMPSATQAISARAWTGAPPGAHLAGWS
jgi:hypothetical protein